MRTFATFFRAATGYEPYGYQARIARDGLPDVVQAPAGTGKTELILAWLWRRLHGPHPDATPRRLIYALPPGSLTEQAADRARRWLDALGLADDVALTVAAAPRWETRGEWRDNLHRPAIVVGTADVLVSKALDRALDLPRALFPIDFALTTNGAQWLVDDAQLCPQTTTTLRQLAAFTARLGTAEPFGLTCLTTAAPDHPTSKKPIQILDIERTGPLATRLAAIRTVRRLPVDPGDYRSMAAAILARRPSDGLTLVVMNTVDAARQVYRRLTAVTGHCTLLHPRFRPLERAGHLATAIGQPPQPAPPDPLATWPGPPDGRIVVTAEVADAGLDLDAALLVAEAAPWPSLVRRLGRCNRAGRLADGGEAWWVPPASPSPDERADIDATAAELARLEGRRLTIEELLARDVPGRPADGIAVLGPSDLDRLFDTEPDPSGHDVDIARYIRDAADLDVELAWATWTPAEDGAPDPEIWAPAAEYRCRVPIGEVVALARDRAVWTRDRAAGGWARITGEPQSRPRPGEVLLISAADGGYDPQTGFDPSAPGPVPGSPELLTPDEWSARAAVAAAEVALAAVAARAGDAALAADAARAAETARPAEVTTDGDTGDRDEPEPRRWQSLDEHSERVRDQAAALLSVLAPGLPAEAAAAAVVAGYLHDLGKAHEIWQDAICALADDDERAEIAAGRPWAKSGGNGPLLFAGDVPFRHELASLLLIDGPLAALLARSPDPDLTRFLVLAHHGKLRVQVRERDDPGRPPAADVIRGLANGATSAIPAMLGQPAGTLTVDLDPFLLDGDRAWTRTVLGLRGRYGPFVLAYLETIVRMADWRASGGRELPAG